MTEGDESLPREGREPTVLFVDGSPEMRELYALEAEAACFSFATAEGALDAIALAHTVRPDIVVSEAILPNVDGFELTRRFARDFTLASTPVILVTDALLPSLHVRARQAGCAAVLTKPCDFTLVVRTVRSVLERVARPGMRAGVVKDEPQVSRPRALVVDDDRAVALSMKRFLDMLGFDASSSGSGQAACDRIAAGERFTLVVSDVRMPGMDGCAFYEAARRLWPEIAERIVFVTGGHDVDVLVKSGLRFFRKPVNADFSRHVRALLPPR